MIGVNVQGGTHAGWRITRPAQTEPWTCGNGHTNKPHHLTCMFDGCRKRRSDATVEGVVFHRLLEKADYPTALLRNDGD